MSEKPPKKQEVNEEPVDGEELKNELTEVELKGVSGGSLSLGERNKGSISSDQSKDPGNNISINIGS